MQGIMREYILTADIGATNTRIALYSTEIKLIELIEIKTDEIKNKESFVRIIKQKLKKIITADNTESFLNEEVQESYHSHSGAVEEAYKKYVIPPVGGLTHRLAPYYGVLIFKTIR